MMDNFEGRGSCTLGNEECCSIEVGAPKDIGEPWWEPKPPRLNSVCVLRPQIIQRLRS